MLKLYQLYKISFFIKTYIIIKKVLFILIDIIFENVYVNSN